MKRKKKQKLHRHLKWITARSRWPWLIWAGIWIKTVPLRKWTGDYPATPAVGDLQQDLHGFFIYTTSFSAVPAPHCYNYWWTYFGCPATTCRHAPHLMLESAWKQMLSVHLNHSRVLLLISCRLAQLWSLLIRQGKLCNHQINLPTKLFSTDSRSVFSIESISAWAIFVSRIFNELICIFD